MPFCATCGAQVEGRFCAKCGSSVVSGGPAPGAPMGAPPMGSAAGPGPQPMAVGSAMADSTACGLCYALGFITGIIFLVLAPYNQNRTVRFHAFQSIFFSVGVLLIRIVISVVLGMMWFAGGGFWLFAGINTLISLGFFCVWLYLIISAFQGKNPVLPIIGPLAQQQA